MAAFNARWNVSPGHAMGDRREGQRARLLWKGDYLVVQPVATHTWQRCYLVDISDAGAAIEIHGDDLDVDHRLLVRLDPHPSYSVSWLQLRATVVSRREPTRPPVYGLTFGGLTRGQREHLLKITMSARRDLRRPRRYKPDA
jgi:c-di-GMP-binding flagellar brake protein YcgR